MAKIYKMQLTFKMHDLKKIIIIFTKQHRNLCYLIPYKLLRYSIPYRRKISARGTAAYCKQEMNLMLKYTPEVSVVALSYISLT